MFVAIVLMIFLILDIGYIMFVAVVLEISIILGIAYMILGVFIVVIWETDKMDNVGVMGSYNLVGLTLSIR